MTAELFGNHAKFRMAIDTEKSQAEGPKCVRMAIEAGSKIVRLVKSVYVTNKNVSEW